MRDDPISGRPPVAQWPVRGALAALIAFSLGWDLWAVLTDLRLSGSDTFTPQLLSAYENYQQSGLGGIIGWMGRTGYKGPLAPLLTMPLLLILDQVPLAPRLISVLAHAVLTWQCYHLAGRVSHGAAAGLWAALIVITTPLIFGWARLSFHEPLLAVMVLGSLQVMTRSPLTRLRQGLLLGLLLGLGLLTKLSFAVFMVAPGIWFMLRHLRSRRSLAMVGVTLAVMGGLSSLWIVPNAQVIYYNLLMSTSSQEGWLEKAQGYLGIIESWGLLSVALGSALVLWVKRGEKRWVLGLLASFIVVPLILFILVFDFWTRYTLPIFPVAAVLAGAGLAHLGGRLPTLLSWPAGMLIAILLLAYYLQLNLAPVRGANPRDFFAGMTSPDRRDYPAFPGTYKALRRHGEEIFMLMDRGSDPNRLTALFQIWRYRGRGFRILDLNQTRLLLQQGRAASVLMIRGAVDHEMHREEVDQPCPPLRSGDLPRRQWSEARRWLDQVRPRRCVRAMLDPDGVAYVAYRVYPPSR